MLHRYGGGARRCRQGQPRGHRGLESPGSRLREVARGRDVEAYMVDNAEQLRPEWIVGKRRIGVTAGASAPEVLVQAVISKLKELGAARVVQLAGTEENVTFPLPKGLSV